MIELDDIDRLAASCLDGYLVRKDLVRTFSRQFPVPTYVGAHSRLFTERVISSRCVAGSLIDANEVGG